MNRKKITSWVLQISVICIDHTYISPLKTFGVALIMVSSIKFLTLPKPLHKYDLFDFIQGFVSALTRPLYLFSFFFLFLRVNQILPVWIHYVLQRCSESAKVSSSRNSTIFRRVRNINIFDTFMKFQKWSSVSIIFTVHFDPRLYRCSPTQNFEALAGERCHIWAKCIQCHTK